MRIGPELGDCAKETITENVLLLLILFNVVITFSKVGGNNFSVHTSWFFNFIFQDIVLFKLVS